MSRVVHLPVDSACFTPEMRRLGMLTAPSDYALWWPPRMPLGLLQAGLGNDGQHLCNVHHGYLQVGVVMAAAKFLMGRRGHFNKMWVATEGLGSSVVKDTFKWILFDSGSISTVRIIYYYQTCFIHVTPVGLGVYNFLKHMDAWEFTPCCAAWLYAEHYPRFLLKSIRARATRNRPVLNNKGW